jgi:hypothetical protein
MVAHVPGHGQLRLEARIFCPSFLRTQTLALEITFVPAPWQIPKWFSVNYMSLPMSLWRSRAAPVPVTAPIPVSVATTMAVS